MKIPFSITLIRAYHAYIGKMRPGISALGLTVGQPKIMDFLMRYDGCMQKDLAALCHIEPATISRLMSHMEADGLITRTVVADNKRAASISLTPLGREQQKKVAEIRCRTEECGLQGFSPEEREQFYTYLTRLYENLSRAEDEGEAN